LICDKILYVKALNVGDTEWRQRYKCRVNDR